MNKGNTPHHEFPPFWIQPSLKRRATRALRPASPGDAEAGLQGAAGMSWFAFCVFLGFERETLKEHKGKANHANHAWGFNVFFSETHLFEVFTGCL